MTAGDLISLIIQSKIIEETVTAGINVEHSSGFVKRRDMSLNRLK